MHLVVDALGLPVDFEVREGRRHESITAVPLVERVRPRGLLGDKGFDTNPFRDPLASLSFLARATARKRRFATRYEKTLRHYASVVALGCAMWLRI